MGFFSDLGSIAKEFNDIKQDLTDTAKDAVDQAANLKADVTDSINDIRDQGSIVVDDAKHTAQDISDKLKK